MIDLENIKINKNIIIPENFTHAICIGETGSGKTTSFIYPNLLYRLKQRHGILIYDYKGTEHFKIKELAKYSKRLVDVIEIGKPWGAKINLIENMSINEIRRILLNLQNINSNEMNFINNSAIVLGINIIQLLRNFHEMDIVLKNVFKDNYQDTIYDFDFIDKYTLKIAASSSKSVFKLPVTGDITLKVLYDIINSPFSLQVFVRASEYIFQRLEDIGRKNDFNSHKYKMYLVKIEKFLKTIKPYYDIDDNLNETKQNIILALESSISRIANNSLFNTPEINIIEKLNKRRIVIIDTESLEKNILSIFNNSIFNNLIYRIKQEKKHNITIFIDEVQRVLDKELYELPIDVFREAKVEVIVALQNQSQLLNKIGQIAFDSIISNFTTKISFRSTNAYDLKTINPIIKDLKTFQFIKNHSDEVFNTEGFMFEQDNINMTEYEYQNLLKIFEFYNIKVPENEQFILVHDQSIYELKNLRYIYDLKKKKYMKIELIDEHIRNMKINKLNNTIEILE